MHLSLSTECPEGFIRRGSHGDKFCYKFVQERLDWEAARTRCLNHTAYLAEPKTEVEINNIKALGQSCAGGDSFWLGASDSEEHSGFTWSHSGENVNSSLTDWSSGQPNYRDIHNCIEVWDEDNYLWNDADCDDKKRFVCQIPR